MKVVPAIMIGGAGTRLWPLSHGNLPKQFLPLLGENSLFQDTVRRFSDEIFDRPWLLTNADTLGIALEQLKAAGTMADTVMVEPSMRGTAAAIAALAVLLARRNPDSLVLAVPSDHSILDVVAFRERVERAIPVAASGRIVTFGIEPTAPETGFGYIRGGSGLGDEEEPVAYEIGPGSFLEKPTRERASEFIASGYLWNAGIFLFKAATLIDEYGKHARQTLIAARKAVELGTSGGSEPVVVRLDGDGFAEAPDGLSIDNAIMEKTTSAAVVPCTGIGWNDVGSLSALWDISPKGTSDNVVKGDALLVESRGSLVHSLGGRKIVASHVNDLIIIDTDDCVTVLPREASQSVKAIVQKLRDQDSPLIQASPRLRFPWGEARVTRSRGTSTCCEVSLIEGAAISERQVAATEVWVVVSGELHVKVNGSHRLVGQGASLSLAPGDSVAFSMTEGGAFCLAVFSGAVDWSIETAFAPSNIADTPLPHPDYAA